MRCTDLFVLTLLLPLSIWGQFAHQLLRDEPYYCQRPLDLPDTRRAYRRPIVSFDIPDSTTVEPDDSSTAEAEPTSPASQRLSYTPNLQLDWHSGAHFVNQTSTRSTMVNRLVTQSTGIQEFPPYARSLLTDHIDDFPDEPLDYRVDCLSGRSHELCFGTAMPACENFCKRACANYCSGIIGPANTIFDCLSSNGLDVCAFRFFETRRLKGRACRNDFSVHPLLEGTPAYGTTGQYTVYVFELDRVTSTQMNAAHFKFLKRAVLELKLESDFISGTEFGADDFGNFVFATDSVDMEECFSSSDVQSISLRDVAVTRSRTVMSPTNYFARELSDNKGVQVEIDITHLLRAPALQAWGGVPPQILVWWPGKQPQFYGNSGKSTKSGNIAGSIYSGTDGLMASGTDRSVDSTSTMASASIKVQYRSRRDLFVSTRGFLPLDDESKMNFSIISILNVIILIFLIRIF